MRSYRALFVLLAMLCGIWCQHDIAQDKKPEPVYETGKDFDKATIQETGVVKYPDDLTLTEDVECIFAVAIDETGKALQLTSIQVPDPKLVATIKNAVDDTKFGPGMLKDRPVTSRLYLHIIFHADKRETHIEKLRFASKEIHPTLISSVDPRFPDTQGTPKLNGTAGVACVVDITGKPIGVHIFQTMIKDYDLEAMAAVQQYRFKPAEVEGKPIPIVVWVFVNYRID